MRTRTLLMALALLLLAFPALAEETTEEGKVKSPEVSVEAPQVEAEQEPAPVVEGNIFRELGLETIVNQDKVEKGLCPACFLSFCRRPGRRCDYVSCNELCCTYTCYADASCTSGSCLPNVCNCKRL